VVLSAIATTTSARRRQLLAAIEARRTGRDQDDSGEEVEVAARRVLRRELDVGREPRACVPRRDSFDAGRAIDAQLLLEWRSEVAMKTWMRLRCACCSASAAATISAIVAARQRGDDGTADGLRDLLDTAQVALRRRPGSRLR